MFDSDICFSKTTGKPLKSYESENEAEEAIEYVKTRPQSWLNSDYKLEGLVLRSPTELYSNNGSRVICKIKVKDFVDGIKDYKE